MAKAREPKKLLTVTLQTVVRGLPPAFWTARRACVLDISAVCRLCFQENRKTAQDLK